MDAETREAIKILINAIRYIDPCSNPLHERGREAILKPLEEMLTKPIKEVNPEGD